MIDYTPVTGMIINGQGFVYSTGKNTLGSTSTMGIQLFNPSTSTKNVLIYRITQFLAGGNMTADMRMVTALDANLSTACVVTNLKAGGPASGIPNIATNASFALTGITAPSQAAASSFAGGGISGSNVTLDLLGNGDVRLLPAGIASGLVVYILFSVTGNSEVSIYGVEY